MLYTTALIHDRLLMRGGWWWGGGGSLLDGSDLTRREAEVRQGKRVFTCYLGTKRTAVIN